MRVINWFDMLKVHIEKHPVWEYLTFMHYVRIFKITNNVISLALPRGNMHQYECAVANIYIYIK